MAHPLILNVNVIAWLEFELAYHEATDQHFIPYASQ